MKRTLLVTGLLMAIAACGDAGSEPPTDPMTPRDVVSAWLAALDGGGDPSEFVLADQLPILASLGRSDEAETIISRGLTAEAEAEFWESFVEGIEGTSGVDVGELRVIDVIEIEVDDVPHGYVDIQGPGGRTTVVVRGVERGKIDLLATSGPALVRPLTTLWNALPEGVIDGPALAASLRAGLVDPNLNLPSQFFGETQDLIALVDR